MAKNLAGHVITSLVTLAITLAIFGDRLGAHRSPPVALDPWAAALSAGPG